MRWRIALLVTAAIAISYLDRQTLPVAIAAIQEDIPISNTQFSNLNTAFLLAYALMYAGGGKLIDVLGTRRGFALIMVVWSLACASHGLAAGFGMLAVSRLLLGMGEGGGFPAATKAVAEWFPVQERSTAMGMINAGAAVGAVIAPPAIAAIITASNWRWVFFIAGVARPGVDGVVARQLLLAGRTSDGFASGTRGDGGDIRARCRASTGSRGSSCSPSARHGGSCSRSS